LAGYLPSATRRIRMEWARKGSAASKPIELSKNLTPPALLNPLIPAPFQTFPHYQRHRIGNSEIKFGGNVERTSACRKQNE